WIEESFTAMGYKVLFIAETATELISGGVAPWTLGSNVEFHFRNEFENEKPTPQPPSGGGGGRVPTALNGVDHFAYIVGYEDGTVRPTQNITRAEVAAIFYRLLNEPVRAQYYTADNDFADVNAGDWFNEVYLHWQQWVW
ncbi:MAG: S-layer homology domain-containing protein, partial [Peptococcaceae bacterium]|nr:S-layer homology domain-containing protein [Peptococcaceae bacterium]